MVNLWKLVGKLLGKDDATADNNTTAATAAGDKAKFRLRTILRT